MCKAFKDDLLQHIAEQIKTLEEEIKEPGLLIEEIVSISDQIEAMFDLESWINNWSSISSERL